MKRGVIETVLGAVVLLVAFIFLGLSYQTANISATSDTYPVKAKFSNIGGLKTGDKVQMAGVNIGRISDISLSEDYLAVVTMNIDNKYKLPEDSAAVVASESLLGGLYMSIEPGAAMDNVESNGELTFTQPYVSLEQLLGKFMFSVANNSDES